MAFSLEEKHAREAIALSEKEVERLKKVIREFEERTIELQKITTDKMLIDIPKKGAEENKRFLETAEKWLAGWQRHLEIITLKTRQPETMKAVQPKKGDEAFLSIFSDNFKKFLKREEGRKQA